jgi:hypothetical protein
LLRSLVAFALVSGACASTRPLVPGRAIPGQIGYGVQAQSGALFGAGIPEVAVAAISPRESGAAGDAVWRVEKGGHQLQYCRVEQGRAACREVSVPQIRLVSFLSLPVRILASGAVEFTPLTPNRSIWVSDRTGFNLYSCSVQDDVPECYAAEVPGGRVAATTVLGNAVIRTPRGMLDVLWSSHLDALVARCETSGAAPEPSCAFATMR